MADKLNLLNPNAPSFPDEDMTAWERMENPSYTILLMMKFLLKLNTLNLYGINISKLPLRVILLTISGQ